MTDPRPSAVPLRTVSGLFYRSVAAERAGEVLAPPGPSSAGRYHRPGESVLYMSPRLEWAISAVSGYIREDGHARVVIPLQVSGAHVLDQHDEEACRLAGIDREASNLSWRSVLAAGGEPPSWRTADRAREAGADGLIDRSRQIPGGWHLNLFRWNTPDAPTVIVAGEPQPIRLSEGGPVWGL
ncbi:hypothetical protein NS365_15235 [Aureimonas ureilytica]|uniref:RES domain-containing protein n=1 Tax=Aureimonas ureilytica TaxID=401562 RepID=A0A175RL45_9HYPH|nr:RES family NAD+ phosphorylase [Aureimonas ureilytica]KTR04447.1 hypothetical protein NS365_15235 [Aureimonas ureilytica]